MIDRRRFLLGAASACLLRPTRALSGDMLVTPDEVELERAFEATQASKREAPAIQHRALEFPVITIVAPQITDASVVAPLRIELAFSTTPGAHVLPDSLHVLYGFIRLDITDKVRAKASVLTADRLVLENAEIPSGNHRFVVRLADDTGRSNEREMRFRVE